MSATAPRTVNKRRETSYNIPVTISGTLVPWHLQPSLSYKEVWQFVTNEFSESTMDAGSVDWLYNDQSTLLSDHPVTLKSDNTAKCLPHIIVTNIRSVKLIYEVDEIESKNKCKNNGVQVASDWVLAKW